MISSDLVTVIIPTYNRADKIADAINSVLAQTYKPLQIIVVDDGSIDGTTKILENFPQIEYYHKENGGQASARNLGLKHSKGNIVASLDSDDMWYPTHLEVCIQKLQSENLDFVFANWYQETRHGESWDFLNNDTYLEPYNHKLNENWVNLNDEELRELYLKTCPSPSSSVVLRKSSMKSGWDESIKIGDDWCMYLEMILSKKCKAAYTFQKLWRKRIDDINVYNGRKRSEILEFLHIADLETKMEKFSSLLRKNEMAVMRKRYMESLVELSKHNLIRAFDIPSSFRLLMKSFSINIPYTLKSIPKIYITAIERKLKYRTKN